MMRGNKVTTNTQYYSSSFFLFWDLFWYELLFDLFLACEMVKKMKEAHELLRNKYEDEVKMLKDRHTVEFCEYEENIRSSLQKKV